MGQSCGEVGKFEFNKIYRIGGKQVEFFKQSDKFYPGYINGEIIRNKFETKAYLKGNNGPVKIIDLFDVGTIGILSLPLYKESYKYFFNC